MRCLRNRPPVGFFIRCLPNNANPLLNVPTGAATISQGIYIRAFCQFVGLLSLWGVRPSSRQTRTRQRENPTISVTGRQGGYPVLGSRIRTAAT